MIKNELCSQPIQIYKKLQLISYSLRECQQLYGVIVLNVHTKKAQMEHGFVGWLIHTIFSKLGKVKQKSQQFWLSSCIAFLDNLSNMPLIIIDFKIPNQHVGFKKKSYTLLHPVQYSQLFIILCLYHCLMISLI